MAQFDTVAAVAPKTIQAVARGEVTPPVVRRRTASGSENYTSSVTVTQLHELLLAYLKENDISMRYVQVFSGEEIIVWNKPL